MRYLNILLLLAMLGFAVVQYNDPDALLWMAYYAVPAAWAFLAAFRLPLVRSAWGQRALWASIAIGLAVAVAYWPTMPGFWRPEVWQHEEAAREGMGLMIAWGVLLVALITARRASAPAATAADRAGRSA